MGMGPGGLESPQDLASEIGGEPFAETSFGSNFSTEQDASGPELDVSTGATGSPGRPVILSASAKGNSVTFTWKRGATGGAPAMYYVVYKGLTQLVGLKTSFSFTASPGHYLVGVYGKNAAGTGPVATTEVSVGSVYDGTFGVSGTIIQTFGSITRRWHLTYKGTVELITDYSPKGGLTGIMRLVGTASTPRGFSSSPDFTCYPGTISYTDIKPVIISWTNIARTGLLMGYSTGTFSGNLSGTLVTGTLKAVYNFGFGTMGMPVMLRKSN